MLMAKIFKPIRWLRSSSDDDSSAAASAAAFQSGASRESRVGTQPVTNTSPSGLSAQATEDAFAGTYAAGHAEAATGSLTGPLAGSFAGSWHAAKEPAPSAEEDAWLALLELVFDETGWPDAEPTES